MAEVNVVPYAYLSYRDYNPAQGRWDQNWIDRILHGEEGRPPCPWVFESSDADHVLANGGIIVFPAGAYEAHGDLLAVRRQLWEDLLLMPWGVLIATSDEADVFGWDLIDPWPDHIMLWVQTPRPDHHYPDGTVFFGCGAPNGPDETNRAFTRDIDVFYSGQLGHERRMMAWNALVELAIPTGPHNVHATSTAGFTQGMEQSEYLFHMSRAWLAPAPSGPRTQDSFRAYEALECGAIPILDGLRPMSRGAGYWEMVGMADVAPVIDDWSMLPGVVDEILADRSWWAALTQSRWQRYKRTLVQNLHWSVLKPPPDAMCVDDLITAVVVTSPIPDHPNPDMTIDTINSVTSRLPAVEVLVGCDGVRAEQAHRADDYHEYLRRLCEWSIDRPQVTPFVFGEHLHQSGMMHEILPEVRTPFVLFMEHDCPLVGDIDFVGIIGSMGGNRLNLMRFMHEAQVLDVHEEMFGKTHDDQVRWRETIQFSARPHLARTDWYRSLMLEQFDPSSRTFIEDVLHGVLQYAPVRNERMAYTDGIRLSTAFKKWRMAVYAPEGDMKRSGHVDGRGSDPKYPMFHRAPGAEEGKWL